MDKIDDGTLSEHTEGGYQLLTLATRLEQFSY